VTNERKGKRRTSQGADLNAASHQSGHTVGLCEATGEAAAKQRRIKRAT
jgi:hypothetical protein